MATAARISVQEYLDSFWRPDRDFVDGATLERNYGEYSHGRLHANVAVWMHSREKAGRFHIVPEVRLQISSSRFRIPDLMLISRDAPREEIVRTAPLLCIEIVSRDDTFRDMMDRLNDYFSIGVPVCWVIDPVRGCGWVATPGNLAEAVDGVLSAGAIEMPLAEVFEAEA